MLKDQYFSCLSLLICGPDSLPESLKFVIGRNSPGWEPLVYIVCNYYYYYYYYYICLTAFFQDNLGKYKPAPERQTILDFTGARDDGVAVASAGP